MIVGDIASSHRWVADRKPHADHLSVDSLRSRAWEFRSKVLRAIKRAPVTEHSPKVWEATLEDVAEGAAVGPFFEESRSRNSWGMITGSLHRGSRSFRRTIFGEWTVPSRMGSIWRPS